MKAEEILERIRCSEMVLVGLGGEFDIDGRTRESRLYRQGYDRLQEAGYHWLIPAWNEYCTALSGNDTVTPAMEKLLDLIASKNYFLVSVSTNSKIACSVEKKDRLVMPCGGVLKKQCGKGCGAEPVPVSDDDRERIKAAFDELAQGRVPDKDRFLLDKCAECGSKMIFNNVYAPNYNEKGYLDNWHKYTKWLQATLNKDLLILELGVDMRFPTVVRWPFEKVSVYNNKAFLCRVNEKIYQLPQEISTKGCGIPQNAIAWLRQL